MCYHRRIVGDPPEPRLRFMKAIVRVFLAIALLCGTAQANETLKIDPAHSTIAFRVRHMLGTAKGNFSKFCGTIELDRDHSEQSSVSVTIEAASINTGIAKRDEHLRSELFNVAKYPEITCKSPRVKQRGGQAGEMPADLTV